LNVNSLCISDHQWQVKHMSWGAYYIPDSGILFHVMRNAFEDSD